MSKLTFEKYVELLGQDPNLEFRELYYKHARGFEAAQEMTPFQLYQNFGKKALDFFVVGRLKDELKSHGVKGYSSLNKEKTVELLDSVYRKLILARQRNAAEAVDEETRPKKRQATSAHKNYIILISMPLQKCSRRVSVPGKMDFDIALERMLESFGFDFGHLYDVTLPNGLHVLSPMSKGFDNSDYGRHIFGDIKLDSLKLKEGDELRMRYDFGDDWRFVLRVDDIVEGAEFDSFKVLKKQRKSTKTIDIPSDEENDY